MSRSPRSRILGGLTCDRFLKSYWQKEPLVVRGAFPGFQDPLSPDELAGLSCEPGVDSRLVLQRGGRRPWQVIRGPQKPGVLRRLPRSHWTLLVESIDRHHPGIAALASAFSFLPKWRMDDVMVSLAPTRGTVGAHVDSYDVFLIQGQGRRRWEVDRGARAEYKPALDLRILNRFSAGESWTLDPGDMLYVPPGVAHRGVTVRSNTEVALTYSVGFRAPSSADLLSSLLGHAVNRASPLLFADPGRPAASDPGELSTGDLARLRRFLAQAMKTDGADAWTLVAGEAATAGGTTGTALSRATPKSIGRRLILGAKLSPSPGSRVAWARLERGRAVLFVNGESQVLPREQAFVAPWLCGRESVSTVQRVIANEALLALLAGLLRAGAVVLKTPARE